MQEWIQLSVYNANRTATQIQMMSQTQIHDITDKPKATRTKPKQAQARYTHDPRASSSSYVRQPLTQRTQTQASITRTQTQARVVTQQQCYPKQTQLDARSIDCQTHSHSHSHGHSHSQTVTVTPQNQKLHYLKETGIAGIMPLMAYLTIRPPTTRSNGKYDKKSHSKKSKKVKKSFTYPELILALLSSCLRVLNNVARLQISAFQEFGSEYQMEILHLLRILLPYCATHIQSGDNNHVEGLLEQLLLFMGYFTLMNRKNQDLFRWGKVPTLMQQLCNLPFAYFSNAEKKELLFPTLICVTFDNSPNKELMLRELNGKILMTYLSQKHEQYSKAMRSKHETTSKQARDLKTSAKHKPGGREAIDYRKLEHR